MTQSKKVQFHDNVHNKDIIIELKSKRKGTYWSYDTVPFAYGPFKNENQAMQDAKLFSTYGTTCKTLLKVGSRG